MTLNEARAAVEEELNSLLAVCDGARTHDGMGLSGADQWLRCADLERPQTLAKAAQALRKYGKTQLGAGARERLATAEQAALAECRTVQVSLARGEYVLRWSYNAALIAAFKAATDRVGRRRFDGLTKAWIVDRVCYDAALPAFEAAGYAVAVSPEVRAILDAEEARVIAPRPDVDVIVETAGPTYLVRAGRFLGDRFQAFRAALVAASSVYDPEARVSHVAPVNVARLVDELRSRELTVLLAAEAQVLVNEADQRKMAMIAEANERADAVSERLKGKGLDLYRFQRTGVQWLAQRKAALLGDSPGLGKTIQALTSLADKLPVLVVAPAAVKGVWQAEAARWRPDYRVTVLQGRGAFRWPEAGEVVVINYDILPTDCATIREKLAETKKALEAAEERDLAEEGEVTGEIETLTERVSELALEAADAEALTESCPRGCVFIADEAHLVKNPKAARTMRFRAVATKVRECDGRNWLLTGTPLLNRPPELWSVLSAAGLEREAFGSWPGFVRLFGGVKGRYGYEWSRPDTAVAERLRSVMLARRREQVLPDLPTKIYRDLAVNGLSDEARDASDRLVEKLHTYGVELDDEDFLAAAQRVAFEDISRVRALIAQSKIPALVEVIESYEDAEEPVVVFCAHLAPVQAVGSRPGWEVLTGETPLPRRTQIVERFQNGELKGIALTIAAGGVGITLTRAAHAVFVDLAWTPALNSQAEDRICRIGQAGVVIDGQRGVVITRLISDHAIDRRVTELLVEKQVLIAATVDAARVDGEVG